MVKGENFEAKNFILVLRTYVLTARLVERSSLTSSLKRNQSHFQHNYVSLNAFITKRSIWKKTLALSHSLTANLFLPLKLKCANTEVVYIIWQKTQESHWKTKNTTCKKRKANETQHSGKVAHSLHEMILMLQVREKQSQCHHASS